ncbi:MAG: hypothetical protein LBE12_11130 [Planctomycetaceae bacterium]|jgi:hypothetical protein|nr:hypothetical protein [Planctomycetaceae bacterium]
MKNLTILYTIFLFLFCVTAISAQTVTAQQWNFDKDREHWNGTNYLKDVQIKDGIYRAVASGGDPFFVASGLDFTTTINLNRIPATDWNRLIIRMKVFGTGSAESILFFCFNFFNTKNTNSFFRSFSYNFCVFRETSCISCLK